jgi:gluconokinase
MGVSACGKTTIAKGIHDGTPGWDFIEGDDWHTESNIKKMSSGHPLTDEDRHPWLLTVHNKIMESIAKEDVVGVVASCSALKHKYREWLAIGHNEKPVIRPIFVHLYGKFEVLYERISNREGHFMKENMLKSQYEALEWPYTKDIHNDPDTHYDTLTVELTREKTSKQVIEEATHRLRTEYKINL